MIAVDKSALICDLAETYGIFDLKALPVDLLATLSVGLREDSRIKMKISGAKVKPEFLLLAAAVDRLTFLAWSKTKDGQKGRKRPKSIVEMFSREQESEIVVFDSAEAFEQEKARILGEGR